MKMLLTAIALTIASPVAAQTAGPADAHAGHAAGQSAQHGQPEGNHASHAGADEHAQHKMDGKCCDKMADGKMMDCCEKMKAAGKMPCCDHKQEKSGAQGGHSHH